jgi:hypothetical protein
VAVLAIALMRRITKLGNPNSELSDKDEAYWRKQFAAIDYKIADHFDGAEYATKGLKLYRHSEEGHLYTKRIFRYGHEASRGTLSRTPQDCAR